MSTNSQRMNHNTTQARLFFTLNARRLNPGITLEQEQALISAARQVFYDADNDSWCVECSTDGCTQIIARQSFKAALNAAADKFTCVLCQTRERLQEELRRIEEASQHENDRIRHLKKAADELWERRDRFSDEGIDLSYLPYVPTDANIDSPTEALLTSWAKAVKARDNHTCQRCGDTNNLHAHHRVPKGDNIRLALDLSNGITLCDACHDAAHMSEDTPESRISP